MAMKNRDRIVNTLNFILPDDRLPMIEWAGWWDKTQARFQKEGIPEYLSREEIREYLGLDMLRQFWISPKGQAYRNASAEVKKVSDMDSYIRVKEILYPTDAIDLRRYQLEKLKPLHDNGDVAIWITLDGFFWFPRTLFGIEDHLYAFYDLSHQQTQNYPVPGWYLQTQFSFFRLFL